jgi:glycosyltransferase involved in cell wall biosynthesis
MAGGDRYSSNNLTLIGVNIPKVGYGKMVLGLKTALENKVNLCDDAEHVVYALKPNMVRGWRKNQKPNLLTMWETNFLPAEFTDFLDKFEKIIVPSLHNFDLFSQHHPNVHVIPLAVDRNIWHPKPIPQTKTYKILCGGSEWYRKGLDVVLETFLKLNLPDTELHIKIVPPHLSAPSNLNHPNVILHDQWMTEEEERDLVRSMDCFVSVSRGEGFGLMPLQSISAGIPTIVSDAHGHREFSDLATHRIPTTPVPTNKGTWKNMGDWDEPDSDALAEAIIDIGKNRERYHRQAQTNSIKTEAFNWDTSANQLLQIIKPSNRHASGEWTPLEPICEIQVNRKIKATIGSHNIDLKPGVTYPVVLNVRNVLRDSGYLVEQP